MNSLNGCCGRKAAGGETLVAVPLGVGAAIGAGVEFVALADGLEGDGVAAAAGKGPAESVTRGAAFEGPALAGAVPPGVVAAGAASGTTSTVVPVGTWTTAIVSPFLFLT
jgi:hypothetical protein